MQTTTMKLTGPETAGAAASRKNFAAIHGAVIGRNFLSVQTTCSVGRAMADFGGAVDREALGVGKNSSFACTLPPDAARLWRSALLPESGKEVFVEKCLYFVLAATVVTSLLMAFWQLRSLEAGWASFVELVGRVVS